MPSLSSIQVSSFMCHFHQGRISPPSRTQELNISSIQVPSNPSMSRDVHIISIEVVSHLYPGLQIHIPPPCGVSPPSKSWHSRLTSISVSPLSRSRELYLSSIQVPPHPTQVSRYAQPLNLGSISPQSSFLYSHLISIHGMPHLHPGPNIQVSPPSSISHLHPGRASPPFRSRRIASQLHPYLISPHPNPRMCISSHQNLYLTSIQDPS